MNIIEANYNEVFLLPPSIEDWIPGNHPARFIREFVETVELKELGFEPQDNTEGRPAYGHRLLLRLWLYGYWEHIRSTRKLEKACNENMIFIWLCGMQTPDHNTLWRFFNTYRKPLRKMFSLSVKTAIKLELADLAIQAIDGTKIQADVRQGASYDGEHLKQILADVERRIEQLEGEIEANEESEDTSGHQLPKELENQKTLREKVSQALDKVQTGETRHCAPQDPEARRMKSMAGKRFSYNAQAVVDSKDQIIVGEDVSNDVNDYAHLVPMLNEAEENTGSKAAVTVVDTGYTSGEALKEAAEQEYIVVSAMPQNITGNENKPYHSNNFKYVKEEDVFVCPLGKKIPFQRERKRREKVLRVYRSAKACNSCPARACCTRDRHGRTIEWQPGREELLQMKDLVKTTAAKMVLGRRKTIVEPVFGQFKANGGFRRWTMRGLDNIKTQWSMMCMVWNLKRIYRAV